MGEPIDSHEMKRARAWIHSQGGLETCTVMSKVWLAIFGNYPWDDVPYIPLFVFRNDTFYYKFSFVEQWVAQWIYPHVMPIAYLRYFRKVKDLGPDFDLTELWLNKLDFSTKNEARAHEPGHWVANLVDKMYGIQRPRGTFGAYSVSTLFSLIALEDFNQHWPKSANQTRFSDAFQRGIDFVEDLCFNQGNSSYLGVLDDGRWWDTLLGALAIAESGGSTARVARTVDYMLKEAMQINGGIPYGLEFEYAPDTDDTGVMVMLMTLMTRDKRFSNYTSQVKKSNEWLISMQNNDGGFGAFAKGVIKPLVHCSLCW